MQSTWFAIVLVSVAVILSVFLTYKMVSRQRQVLKEEGKQVPSSTVIFLAGLVTISLYVAAVVSAILLILTPFANPFPSTPMDAVSNLFTILILACTAIATALYWLFVRLGIFSWKALTAA